MVLGGEECDFFFCSGFYHADRAEMRVSEFLNSGGFAEHPTRAPALFSAQQCCCNALIEPQASRKVCTRIILAGLNQPERIQLVLDWHFDMQEEGRAVAERFDPTLIVSYYHQLHTQRVPLTPRQLRSLDNIIHHWNIPHWMNMHYPDAQGLAPAPPAPPVEENEGFAFLPDDEADAQQ